MEHLKEKMWGIAPAIAGGMGKFYWLQVGHPTFLIKLAGAGLTALVCGMLGAFGQQIVTYIKAKYFTK